MDPDPGEKSLECPVCHVEYEGCVVFVLQCGHSVCNDCKNKKRCPVCTAEIKTCVRNKHMESLLEYVSSLGNFCNCVYCHAYVPVDTMLISLTLTQANLRIEPKDEIPIGKLASCGKCAYLAAGAKMKFVDFVPIFEKIINNVKYTNWNNSMNVTVDKSLVSTIIDEAMLDYDLQENVKKINLKKDVSLGKVPEEKEEDDSQSAPQRITVVVYPGMESDGYIPPRPRYAEISNVEGWNHDFSEEFELSQSGSEDLSLSIPFNLLPQPKPLFPKLFEPIPIHCLVTTSTSIPQPTCYCMGPSQPHHHS